ncbi:MAG: four helix bundle protein [Thermodesulfovibrionales bacterium]|nr:four helix bundle protein [Thermodesulfovibrionales bacterium]
MSVIGEMMSKINKVEELEVFKKSHKLTLDIYKVTEKFPQTEKFGLISQMRRASSSICTNLLEGSHRLGRKEFRQFVGIAKGSAGELKYQILLSKDLGYLAEREYLDLRDEIEQISMMLNGLVKSLTDTNH